VAGSGMGARARPEDGGPVLGVAGRSSSPEQGAPRLWDLAGGERWGWRYPVVIDGV
jgi:hypothetical protein